MKKIYSHLLAPILSTFSRLACRSQKPIIIIQMIGSTEAILERVVVHTNCVLHSLLAIAGELLSLPYANWELSINWKLVTFFSIFCFCPAIKAACNKQLVIVGRFTCYRRLHWWKPFCHCLMTISYRLCRCSAWLTATIGQERLAWLEHCQTVSWCVSWTIPQHLMDSMNAVRSL